MARRWLIRVFGGLRVTAGSEVFDRFETHRSAKALALLVIAKDGKASRQDLARALWPDEPFEVTRLRLRQELCRLRKALGPAASLVSSDAEYVYVEKSSVQSDYTLLRTALRLAPTDVEYADAVFRAAELCSERLLPDWDDPWLVAAREVVEQRQGRCLAEATRLALERGDSDSAVNYAAKALRYRADDDALRALFISLRPTGSTEEPPDDPQKDRSNEVAKVTASRSVGNPVRPRGSLASGPGNPPAPIAEVPRPLDAFFGRTAEVQDLTRLLKSLDGPRLITILAPGGMGKTRLATEVGLRLAAQGPGSVGFIALVDIRDSDQIAHSVLSQLGLQPPPGADLVAYVARALPESPYVLILDNLEHLLPKAAEFVMRLLAAKKHLKVLVTSRVAVRVSGESRYVLGPLDVDTDATEMLLDIGRAVRPGLALDRGAKEAFRQLARKLEGIPLAIRLAGPRLRFVGPLELLSQLEDRLVVRAGGVDLAPRHRSLEAALEWSYEALTAGERDALLAIAQFPGGCAFSHLGRMVSGQDIFYSAETLTDTSLIYVMDSKAGIRLGMLETVREYTFSKASEEALAAAKSGFVECMADLLVRLIPNPLVAVNQSLLAELDAEFENLNAATSIAIRDEHKAWPELSARMWVYELLRGRDKETLDRFDLVKDREDQLPDRLRAWLLHGAGFANYRHDSHVLAREQMETASRLYRATGQLGLSAVIESYRRYTIATMGRISPDVLDGREQRREFALSDPSPTAIGRNLAYEGGTLYAMQQSELAVEVLRESVRCSERTGDQQTNCFGAYMLALALSGLGRYEEALQMACSFQESATILKDPRWVAFQIGIQGWLQYTLGRYDEAEAGLLTALKWWQVLEYPTHIGSTYNCLARLALQTGRLDEGLKWAQMGFEVYQRVGVAKNLVSTVHTLAEYRRLRSETELAVSTLSMASRYALDESVVLPPVEEPYRLKLMSELGQPEPCSEPCPVERLESLFAEATGSL